MTELPSRPDRGVAVAALDVLKARLISIVLVLVAAGVAMTYFVGFWSPPRFVWVVLAAALATLPIAVPSGIYARNQVGSTDWFWLVALDAGHHDLAIARMPQRHIADLDVLDGELSNPAPGVYCCRSFDLDAMTAEGTWAGTLDDRQLLASFQAIRECRNQLERDAREGFLLRNNLYSIIRSAVTRNTRNIVQAFEESALPDRGESIDTIIAETLDDWDPQGSRSLVDDDDLVDLDLDLDDLADLQEFQEARDRDDDRPDHPDPLAYDGGDSDD